MELAIRKLIEPNDCTLAIALPLTRDEFLHDLQSGSRKAFAASYARKLAGFSPEKVWERYRKYSDVVTQVAAAVERCGVRVLPRFTLGQLSDTLQQRTVLTLVAHWEPAANAAQDPGQVEFFDALHPIDAVIRQMPAGFSGIFDLTICQSTALGQAIKRAAPDCLVTMNKQNASFDLRLLLYRAIIEQLTNCPAPFVDAVTQVRLELKTAMNL